MSLRRGGKRVLDGVSGWVSGCISGWVREEARRRIEG